MLFNTVVSRGQGSPVPASGGATEPITGEQFPVSGKPVTYQHHFEELRGASWHVEGAAAINGTPIALIPNGNISAESNEVTITWDKVSRGLVQLLKSNEDAAATILGNMVVYPDQERASICPSWEVWYRGQVNNNGNVTPGRVSPISLCPNTVAAGGYTPPSSQLHEFEFDAYCIGNFYNSNNYRYYVWTLEYTTAANHVYRESWYTYGSAHTVARFYMFDVVPSGSPSNFNKDLNQDPNSQPLNFGNYGSSSTASVGERIVGVNVKYKGYSCSCGSWDPFFRDKEDDVNVQYYGQQPTGITLSGGTAPLCRNGQSYTLSAGTVFDATSYSWNATNGATISGTGGNNATVTLNLANTSPMANSITVTARANNSASSCAPATSPPISLTLALAPAPAAADNITITRESCVNTAADPKTATAFTGGDNTGFYSWSIQGNGAAFLSGITTKSSTQGAVAFYTPNAGPVTITAVREANACNGQSVAYSRTFSVGPQPLSCPASGIVQPAGGWCVGISGLVSFTTPAPGFRLIITDAYSLGNGTVVFN
ncbi:MAG: hypothetical protein M3Y12_09400 [Bacteroidota bacterium]|nr:hypothetical protein [Bacteroidota bacterium]